MMEWLGIGIASVLSFLILVLLFIPMERVFPAWKSQRFFRKGWVLDVCYFIGQYWVWNTLVLLGIDYFEITLNPFIPAGFQQAVASQPWWLQFIEVVLLSDVIIYWGHRLQHRWNFLWRFHKVHHSAEHLDWLAAHREHPLDTVYTIGLINLPAIVLGFPMETMAGFIAFRGIWAIFIHSNVKLPLGPLGLLIGSPALHHWHHDLERDRGNYANISPLMDLIFGTHYNPDHEPEKLGIREDFPKNYIGQMLHPLMPAKVNRYLHNYTPKKPVLTGISRRLKFLRSE